ncbi:MAG TPA: biopolymer transporter ExbD, partial [Spongiibacteraceae bacterium]|nr:biopolymer transporter ExbD [Spongiibacteraceae bacterium]
MTSALYPRRAASADDNMIPLINIVFLLLIFFMIAGRIASDDALQLTLPQAQQAAPAPELRVEILVDRDGRIALDGVVVSVEQLAAQLAGLQQRGVNTAEVVSGLAVA